MSLINDALKKAQRERSEGGTDITAGPSGTATSPGLPRRGNSLFVLAGAALVLVFVSVGVTMYLVNRSAASKPVAKTEPASPPAQQTPSASAPVKAPEIPKAAAAEVRTSAVKESPPPAPSKAASVAETKPAPTPPPTTKSDSVSRPATASIPTSSVATASTSAGISPAPTPEAHPAVASSADPVVASPTPATSAAPGADERIHQFIDNIRVAGVRAAGNDSRVMMNDKVFRLNEIVERTLSLRLIKVETNSLTFSDANGNTYVKYF